MSPSPRVKNRGYGHYLARERRYTVIFPGLLCLVLCLAGVPALGAETAGENGNGEISVIDVSGIIDVSNLGVIPLGQVPDERITVTTTLVNTEKRDISGIRLRTFLVRSGREDVISMQLGSDFRDLALKPGEVKTLKNNYVVSKQLKPGEYKLMVRVEGDVTAEEKTNEYSEFVSDQPVTIGKSAEAGGSVPVYSPAKIETPGSYLLMRDVNGGSRDSVFRITTSGVTIDGGGHVIRGTPTGYSSGIYVDGGGNIREITIRNCIFEDVDFGLWLYKVDAAVIEGCTFRNCSNIGLRFDQTRTSSIIGNRFEGNALGIGLFQSSANTVTNNYFANRFSAAVNEDQRNIWSTEPVPGTNILGGDHLAGNAWFDERGGGFSATSPDSDGNGIADQPYTINGVNIDYYPLVSGSSELPVPAEPGSQVLPEDGDRDLPEKNVTAVPEEEERTEETGEPAGETEEAADTGSERDEDQPETGIMIPDGEETADSGDESSVPAETAGSEENITIPAVGADVSSEAEPVSPAPEPVFGMDLNVTAVSSPLTGCPGGEFPVTVTIGNAGASEAGDFFIRYYLSDDTSITPGDIEVGSTPVALLSSMEMRTISEAILLPADLPVRYYTLGAIADPDLAQYEENRQNNIRTSGPRVHIRDCSP